MILLIVATNCTNQTNFYLIFLAELYLSISQVNSRIFVIPRGSLKVCFPVFNVVVTLTRIKTSTKENNRNRTFNTTDEYNSDKLRDKCPADYYFVVDFRLSFGSNNCRTNWKLTGWLTATLQHNKRYHQFETELIDLMRCSHLIAYV